MTLTKKQRDFVDAYVQHWNASQAARDAGYSGKVAGQQGYENLKKPEIVAEIEARILAMLPKGEIVQRLAARSRATIADVIRIPTRTPTEPPADGEPGAEAPQAQPAVTVLGDSYWLLDLAKAQETGGIHQIKKLKQGKYGAEIEMYDPLPAWELAGRFLKFLDDGGGILKYLDLSKLSKEQLQRLADGEDPIAVLLSTTTDPGPSGAGAA